MTSVLGAAWENLPDEIWVHFILSYLSVKTLSKVALVSKKLNKLATDPLLWISKRKTFKIKKAKIISEKPAMRFLSSSRFSKMTHLDLSPDEKRKGSCRLVSLDFAKELFIYILSNDCKITSIDLSYVNIRSSNGEGFINEEEKKQLEPLVGRAIAKLKLSNLSSFMLETQHKSPNHSLLATILQEIKTTTLHQSIDFSFFDFLRVDPSLFAEAISSLKRAKLLDCKLTSAHLTALFAFINNQESTSLIGLFIANPPHVVPENSPEELASSIAKLKHIQIKAMKSLDQTRAVLEAVPNSNLESMLCFGLTFRKDRVSGIGIPIPIIRNAIRHLNHWENLPEDRFLDRLLGDQFIIWELFENETPGYFFEDSSEGKSFPKPAPIPQLKERFCECRRNMRTESNAKEVKLDSLDNSMIRKLGTVILLEVTTEVMEELSKDVLSEISHTLKEKENAGVWT